MAEKKQNNDTPSVPEQWPDPVDGAELLDEIEQVFKDHVVFREGCTEALALWTLFTYVFDEFDVSPLLIITSPEKRCGKTQTLRILNKVVNKPLLTSNITMAALSRIIGTMQPTLLIDEADTFMMSDKSDLIGILNSGHLRDTAFRVLSFVNGEGGYTPGKISTWAPKAIAYIDKKRAPDTLEDRSIEIPMRRKKSEESVSPLRENIIVPRTLPIRRKALRWANDNRANLSDIDPELPDGLNDRQADNWLPLIAIATLVGEKWTEKAIRSAKVLSDKANEEKPSEGILLLGDCREIFRKRDNPNRIHTEKLIRELNHFREHPWGEYGITEKALADKLSAFDIAPKNMRIDGSKPKRGYERKPFEDAFDRYLASETETSVTSETYISENGREVENGSSNQLDLFA